MTLRQYVSEFELSVSPYGTFDQGGNLWEWNETVFDSSKRGWRGGSFYYDRSHTAASDRSYSFDPRIDDYSLGFRVVSIPEPTSILLLGLGGAGLILRNRK